MKRNLLLLLLLVTGITVSAQEYHPENVSSKTIALYRKVLDKMADGYIKEAIPALQKIISLDSNFVDAYLSLAGAYGEMKAYNNSVTTYEKARDKDTGYFKIYNLPYSINLAGLGKFEGALQAVNSFLGVPNLSDRSLKSARYRKTCYEFAVDYQKKHPDRHYIFEPKNLGDSINSPQSEYYPSLSIDDSLLVFTRRTGSTREDFMESNFIKGNFSRAKEIRGDINSEPYKGAITVAADGTWLIFAGNFKKGMGDFDIYISYLTDDGWSEPENMGPAVNSEYWDSSPCLSPDNRVLYFSSNRPGGYGGKDLYYSIRSATGRWSAAKNMGKDINSAGDETAPYIHADNQTLYFTSDGLPGYGGTDLFICKKDSAGNWGKPENLGYPINTIENEGSICVSSNGSTAYYASDRADSRGGLDLYQFTLREDIKPFKTLYVKGKITDARNNKGLPCAIELIDNNNTKTVMRIQADENGKYFIPLPSGKDYTFTVNRKGYFFYSQLYELSKKMPDSTYQKDIALQPLAANASLTLKNIQFNLNSFELLPVSHIELNKLVETLNDNPTLHIQIVGHTDNTGDENYNQTLSQKRARAVAQYLADNGIDVKRFSYKGIGATKPVADNNTEEGKALNRRTEIIITSL
jgi:outer membrane protein OmpA-like peptidoglycan-associated protein